MAVGGLADERNDSLQQKSEGQLAQAQSFTVAGSDEELEKAWSRAQGQSREAHLGLRWLLRLCSRQMLQQVLLDVWEFLTSSQRRPKSLVQESLQGNKPSPRCSNSLACCNGASARGAAEPGRRDGLSPAPLSTEGKAAGGKGRGSSADSPRGQSSACSPSPSPARGRGPRGCAARGEPGREPTFSPELLGELSSRWLSAQLRRLIQASSPMVSRDALRNCRREQERKRMLLGL